MSQTMSLPDLVWEMHQREVRELKSAKAFALGACGTLRRLIEGIRDNRPEWAAAAIDDFIENWNGDHHLEKALGAIDHLIAPVALPVALPATCNEVRDRKGHRVPTATKLVERKSAHAAAQFAYSVFGSYFFHKADDRLTTQGLAQLRVMKPLMWRLDAVDALLDADWDDITADLQSVLTFDCHAWAKAIESESQAAIERTRLTIQGRQEDTTAEANSTTTQRVVRRDSKTEARDKWIYEQVLLSVPYSKIRGELTRKPKGWTRLRHVNSVKAAARRYAKRHLLPLPPPRKAQGRPPKTKRKPSA